jgi:chromate reductase, NAD(P)H dehydrogenase (quinone)
MKILGICGSLQSLSANLALLHVAAASTPPNVDFDVFDGLRDLPLFNPDVESSGAPESVLRWRRALTESDAVFIASPEYGFSLPGALKNGIDWVIGSGELEGKIVAITAAVPSPERGRCGLQALRDTLSAVRATIVGGEPIAKGPDFHSRIAELVADLLHVVAHASGVRGSFSYFVGQQQSRVPGKERVTEAQYQRQTSKRAIAAATGCPVASS